MNQEYLHVTPKDLAEELINKGIIDNTSIPLEKSMCGKAGYQYFVPVKNKFQPIKAFVWDILKAQESGYSRVAPWVSEENIEKIRMGNTLKIIPRFIDRYKVENFRALTFNISKEVEESLCHGYMVNGEGKKIYVESATHKPIRMLNLKEVDIGEACENILQMKPPFVTYKFPEGDDGYDFRDLRFESEITVQEIPAIGENNFRLS